MSLSEPLFDMTCWFKIPFFKTSYKTQCKYSCFLPRTYKYMKAVWLGIYLKRKLHLLVQFWLLVKESRFNYRAEDFSTYLAIAVLPPLGSLTAETTERRNNYFIYYLCFTSLLLPQTLSSNSSTKTWHIYSITPSYICHKQQMAAHLDTFVANLI